LAMRRISVGPCLACETGKAPAAAQAAAPERRSGRAPAGVSPAPSSSPSSKSSLSGWSSPLYSSGSSSSSMGGPCPARYAVPGSASASSCAARGRRAEALAKMLVDAARQSTRLRTAGPLQSARARADTARLHDTACVTWRTLAYPGAPARAWAPQGDRQQLARRNTAAQGRPHLAVVVVRLVLLVVLVLIGRVRLLGQVLLLLLLAAVAAALVAPLLILLRAPRPPPPISKKCISSFDCHRTQVWNSCMVHDWKTNDS